MGRTFSGHPLNVCPTVRAFTNEGNICTGLKKDSEGSVNLLVTIH